MPVIVNETMTKPCAGCPFRKDNGTRSHPIPGKHTKLAHLFDGQPGMHEIMECHTLPEGEHGACVGYLLSEHVWDNLSLRIAMIEGRLDLTVLEPDGELYSTYREMVDAYDDDWGDFT